jgi:hypothetical protein
VTVLLSCKFSNFTVLYPFRDSVLHQIIEDFSSLHLIVLCCNLKVVSVCALVISRVIEDLCTL